MNLSSWIANPWAHMPAWLAFEPFGWNISLFDLCIAVVLWIGAWIVLSVGKTLITRTLERYA
ncbi:MAG TPA: hypothetical protein PK765_02310 [bacterium]|nr:hypothetical protein [bacterium]